MLELHDCIYCGQPLVVNKSSGKVFNISCGHFEQEVMFYMVQGVGVPTGVVAAAVPHPTWPTATEWVLGDGNEEDE